MKYVEGTKMKKHRDWIVIALLYGMIAFMLATAYFGVQLYVVTGHAEQCEATK